MQLKPFYTYDEVARLEVVTVGTLTTWISRDRQLPDNERRFPGAFGGLIPLADVKARYGLTNDDVKAMDLPDPAPRRVATAPLTTPAPAGPTEGERPPVMAPSSTRPDGVQLELFGPPMNVRRGDPDTSWLAAAMAPGRRRTDRLRALEIHRANPDGLTDYELADLMDRQQNSAGKRRGELVQLGFVEDSGRRRPAPSGASAIVWRVVPF